MQIVKIFLLSTSLLTGTLAFAQEEKLVEAIPSFYYLEEATVENGEAFFWVRSCRNTPSKAELQGDDLFTQTGLGCIRVAKIARTDLDRFLREMEAKLPGDGASIGLIILGAGLTLSSMFVKSDDLFFPWLGGATFSFLGAAYASGKKDEKEISFEEFESQIQSQIVGRVEHEWALEIFTDFLNQYGIRP